MPNAPLRPCAFPRCPALLKYGEGSYCKEHLPLSPKRFGDRTRGTATQRGYGAAWKKLRDQVIKEEVLCALCREENRVELAVSVDHIVPKAAGGTDDRSNLRAMCERHHKGKTAREAAAIKRGDYRR
jgi:5-methylcytosine-specific restriction protein A